MSNCLFEATLQEIEKICNCTLKYYVDIAEGYEACEGGQRKCMNQLMVEMGDKREVNDHGDIKVSYYIKTSSVENDFTADSRSITLARHSLDKFSKKSKFLPK